MAELQDTNAVRNANDARFQSNVRAAQVQQHNPLLNIRDRLFYALFCRVGLVYARSVPRQLQRTLEFLLLFEALVALGMLTYIHMAFVREPVDCLHHVHGVWPKDGVLRVEILKNASEDYSLLDSYKKLAESSHLIELELSDLEETSSSSETDIVEVLDSETNAGKNVNDRGLNKTFLAQMLHTYFHPVFVHLKKMTRMFMHEDTYIVEYALEYGFLRMTPKTRSRLNLTVMLVVLDPLKDECFGGWFSQVMLEEFLGYEDILLSSLQQLAKQQNNSGFFRNVWSGDHYRFIEVSVSRVSYVAAAFLMVFFTLSISMLLRYAHQQIFLFIVDLLQVFDRNALVAFPLAPLLTAVLALIGVEALMSELFIEASTAFYVILIVWLADQYDVICCHTHVSRRHWLRFFYLYHFVFYAYHYRFNGHFSSITLATSWLFIQHSMIYFFHHYELPAIIHQTRVQRLLFHAQQQSLTFQASMRDNPDLMARPETPLEQQPTTIGTVVALLPDDLHGRSRSSEGAGFGEGAPAGANSATERLGQQRDSWSLFSLPSFRLSNSLILAQVFVRRPALSRQGPVAPSRPGENEEPSSSGVNDWPSPDVAETGRPSTHVGDETTSNPSVSMNLTGSSAARELLDAVDELPETSRVPQECDKPLTQDSLVLTRDSLVPTQGSLVQTQDSLVPTQGSLVPTQDSLVQDDGAVHNLHNMGDARDEDKLNMFPVDATSPDCEAQYYQQQDDNVNATVLNRQATYHASQFHMTSDVNHSVMTDMNRESGSAVGISCADERLGLVFHGQDPPSAMVPANQDFDSANHVVEDPVSVVSSDLDSVVSFDQDLGHVSETGPRTSDNNADITRFGDLTGD